MTAFVTVIFESESLVLQYFGSHPTYASDIILLTLASHRNGILHVVIIEFQMDSSSREESPHDNRATEQHSAHQVRRLHGLPAALDIPERIRTDAGGGRRPGTF